MNSVSNILRGSIFVVGIILIAFNAQLYVLCRLEKNQINALGDGQKADAEANSNKFKYQREQMESIAKDLESAQQQIKEQKYALSDAKDAFAQEVEKREHLENESNNIRTSLVDIKAETDAIKQDVKGWQKDYVSVLAELERGIDTIQGQIKGLKTSVDTRITQLEHSKEDQATKDLQASSTTTPPPATVMPTTAITDAVAGSDKP